MHTLDTHTTTIVSKPTSVSRSTRPRCMTSIASLMRLRRSSVMDAMLLLVPPRPLLLLDATTSSTRRVMRSLAVSRRRWTWSRTICSLRANSCLASCKSVVKCASCVVLCVVLYVQHIGHRYTAKPGPQNNTHAPSVVAKMRCVRDLDLCGQTKARRCMIRPIGLHISAHVSVAHYRVHTWSVGRATTLLLVVHVLHDLALAVRGHSGTHRLVVYSCCARRRTVYIMSCCVICCCSHNAMLG